MNLRTHFSKKYRSFLRLRRNHNNRKRLCNKDFTILSCNCIGGVIYHELHQPFLSPTVNLFFKANDFIKFLSNLTFYLEQPVTPVPEDDTTFVPPPYPVGLLYDIKLYFVHYKTLEEAEAKWNERKKRINFSNLYIIMAERENCTYEDILAFDALPYEHKIIFTHKEYPEIKSAHCIPDTDSGCCVRDLTAYLNRFTGTRYIDKFDYVDWFNQ